MTGYSFPFSAPHVPFLSSAVTRPPSGDPSLPRALPLTTLHVLFRPVAWSTDFGRTPWSHKSWPEPQALWRGL